MLVPDPGPESGMYLKHFGLAEQPFGVGADPRFFYVNAVYDEACAGLVYGIRQRKGFLALTGEVGTGKTTVARRVLRALEASVRVVYLYNASLGFDEILRSICTDLGLSRQGDLFDRIERLNGFMEEHGSRGVVVALLIDEAQNLPPAVLENLRLLSNLEADGEKLLQIVLIGQPELETKLNQPELRQLRQRVAVWCRLERLADGEIRAFIRHRLVTAGGDRSDLFSDAAIDGIASYSGGIPRLINLICDSSLLIAYGLDQRSVSAEMVDEAAADLGLREPPRRVVEVGQRGTPASRPPPARSSNGPPSGRLAIATARAPVVDREWEKAPADRLWVSIAAVTLVAGGAYLWQFEPGTVEHIPQAFRGAATSIPSGPVLPALGETTEASASHDGDWQGGDDRGSSAGAPADGAVTGPLAAREALPAVSSVASSVRIPTLPSDAPAESSGAPKRTRGPVVIDPGETIDAIAGSAYGARKYLGIDLIREFNPQIENLSRIAAGSVVWVPPLDQTTLIRGQADGSYRVILESFVDREAAETLALAAERRGYRVAIVTRELGEYLVTLHRVEIVGLPNGEVARRTWERAAAMGWLSEPGRGPQSRRVTGSPT